MRLAVGVDPPARNGSPGALRVGGPDVGHDVIAAKRDGREIPEEDLRALVLGYADPPARGVELGGLRIDRQADPST